MNLLCFKVTSCKQIRFLSLIILKRKLLPFPISIFIQICSQAILNFAAKLWLSKKQTRCQHWFCWMLFKTYSSHWWEAGYAMDGFAIIWIDKQPGKLTLTPTGILESPIPNLTSMILVVGESWSTQERPCREAKKRTFLLWGNILIYYYIWVKVQLLCLKLT